MHMKVWIKNGRIRSLPQYKLDMKENRDVYLDLDEKKWKGKD